MYDYANLCKTMYATDPILFSSLRAIMREVCVKIHPDTIRSFEEKVV